MKVATRMRAAVEDRLLTAPNPFFQPAFVAPHATVIQAVNDLRETSAWNTGALMPRDACEAVSAEITRALAGLRPDVRTAVNERTGIGLVQSPFHLHPAILEFATHPLLLAVVEHYLRRRIYLADIDIRRVPPMTMEELDARAGTRAVGYTSSHWHRDIRGRQVKVMIYLTDVAESDSNFAYYPGTHRGFQFRPARVEESRVSDTAAADPGIPPVEWYGAAGDAYVFDTNALHRLRRKRGATVRDSVTYYYTPGQALQALDVDERAMAGLPAAARAIFGRPRPRAQ